MPLVEWIMKSPCSTQRSQGIQCLLKIRRPGSGECFPALRARVGEGEFVGVQKDTWSGISGEFSEFLCLLGAVGVVASDREADVLGQFANGEPLQAPGGGQAGGGMEDDAAARDPVGARFTRGAGGRCFRGFFICLIHT